ncbi:alpha/beta hydrolase [Leptospira perolatii]|uniref:Alpha/beta hydrolase n=1 Tax=Leptospira perolatii TaxID=2023191 RepID=A0A2M9ZSU2_9LEPT|nr:alpha/beta fold hydrolase [Leptospira perolatii]PJZ68795.1 alpha/beta hydrolase [Leptospira perolatii]PJZ75150.1 alpha/beta hydrolase [Leptospira perolatii]
MKVKNAKTAKVSSKAPNKKRSSLTNFDLAFSAEKKKGPGFSRDEFQEAYVPNGELSLYVKYNHTASESPNRPTLLFVHGYPDDHTTWSYQMEALSDKFNVAACDLRGSGKSSKPKEQKAYNVRRMMEDLEKVIQFIGNNKPVHLVAHDWGAVICWAFIADSKYSKWVTSYTAMGCPHPVLATKAMFRLLLSFNPIHWWKAFRQSIRSFYIIVFQIPWLPQWIWSTFSFRVWQLAMTMGGVPKKDPLRLKTREKILSSSISTLNLYKELVRGERFPEIQQIKIPVQVLIPIRDFALSPECYTLHSGICESYTEHKIDCNHWIQRIFPQYVSEKILEHVRSV